MIMIISIPTDALWLWLEAKACLPQCCLALAKHVYSQEVTDALHLQNQHQLAISDTHLPRGEAPGPSLDSIALL